MAEEAGLAIGSVRHYFDGHTDLMVFAMRASLDRVSARLMEWIGPLLAAQDHGERVEGVEGMLAELLPLDERRRKEATIRLDPGSAMPGCLEPLLPGGLLDARPAHPDSHGSKDSWALD